MPWPSIAVQFAGTDPRHRSPSEFVDALAAPSPARRGGVGNQGGGQAKPPLPHTYTRSILSPQSPPPPIALCLSLSLVATGRALQGLTRTVYYWPGDG